MTKRKDKKTEIRQRSSEELTQLFHRHEDQLEAPGPDEARRIIPAKKRKKVTYTTKGESKSLDGVPVGAMSFASQPGLASNTVQSPASIAELARALKNDVDLIYYHVYNQIEYYPTFGLQKGGLGALIDGIGNPFDQCQLLVDLLTEAGYTAVYQFGDLDLSTEEISAWLGTDSSNISYATNVLLNGGVPHTSTWTGTEWRVKLSHVWVKVTIDSTDYLFDPSYKSYSSTTGINLGTAMGYSRTDLIDAAETGATIDTSGNWIEDVDYDGIKSELTDYSMDLVDYIKTNNPTATMDDILGGRTINQISSPVRMTSIPYRDTGVSVTTWTSIPNSYRVLVEVEAPGAGFDEVFYGDELYGKRLTVWFNGSNEPELRLDGTLIDTGTAIGLGGYLNFNIHFVHPYAVAWFDEWVYPTVRNGYPAWQGTGKIYWLLGISLGATSKGMVDIHQEKVAEAKASGSTEFAEDLLGEQLAEMFYTYQAECTIAADLMGRISDSRQIMHHWAMAVGRDDEKDIGFFDGTSPRNAFTPLSGDWTANENYVTAWSMHANALERLVVEQITGMGEGIGINSVLKAANDASLKLYRGDDSTWATDVAPNLSNYTSVGGTGFISGTLSYGWIVAIPEEGEQTIGSHTASGWGFLHPDGGASGFVGILKGGAGPWGQGKKCKCKKCEEEESDPVGLSSGAYKYRQTDMTLGSSSFPYQLSFDVDYSSADRFSDGPLGWGWSHNWQLGSALVSEPFRGLGSSSPIQAAASLVSFYTCMDLAGVSGLPVSEIVTAWLTTNWWCDNMNLNVFSASTLEGSPEFLIMPDGTYQPTTNEGWSLSESSGEYTVTTPQQVEYTYNTDGDLETIEYPNGVTITLSYTSGKLTSVTNGMGRTLTLSYTGDKLTGVSDGNGRSVSYDYDVDGQLDTITDLMGEDTTFTYDGLGQIESFFLPENPASPMVTNTYDSLGRIESQLDMNSEQQEFYFAGWRTEFKNALGESIVRHYNRAGNTIKEIDELGFVTSYEYDGLNRTVKKTMPEGDSISWTYDSKNNILTEIRSAKPSSGLSDIVETFTYHATFNKVATHEDGRGNTTTYSYNSSTGNLETIERPDIGMNTPTATFTYNGRGQVLTRTDETGIVTKFEYDTTTEILEQVTVDEGMGQLNLLTVLGYNAWGDVDSVTDPRGNETEYTFDAKRRLTQVENAAPFGYITNVTYDKNDNRLTIERQTGDVGHPWQVFTATYNLANQVATLKDPLNNTSTRQYDDLRRLWKVTDPESRVTEYQYDERNLLKKVIDPASNDAQVFTYTDNGLKASVVDAKGNVTSYLYDGFDRLDKTVYPDGTFEQNASFDGNSNVTSMLTRAGDTIGFQFDVLNRMTQKSPDGMAVVTFVYDLAGRLTSVSTPVVAGNPASGEWEYGYDTAGRLTSEEAPDGKTISYQLDENGNVERIDYADGYYVVREYDEINRLTAIKLNGSSTPAVEFDYDDLSRRTQMTFDNGVQTDYDYEWNDDMSSIEHAFNGSDLDFAYGFNDANQLISQTISDNQYSWHPTVDQLLEYQSNELNQYDYASGSCGRLYKGYNADGCLIDDGVWKFGYDTENHLISANDGTTSVDYVYDPTHRQIQKDVDGTKTRYVYSAWQHLADYDGTSDTLQTRYVYGVGLNEPLISVSAGGVLTYMHADQLGSIMALTDNTGAVTNRFAYSPWGESDSMSGTTFGFTGQRFDEETGLYFYKNRYYSPVLARFLQPDPIPSNNLYLYGINDPLNRTDSLGLTPDKPRSAYDQARAAMLSDPSLFGAGCRDVANFIARNPPGTYPEEHADCFGGYSGLGKALKKAEEMKKPPECCKTPIIFLKTGRLADQDSASVPDGPIEASRYWPISSVGGSGWGYFVYDNLCGPAGSSPLVGAWGHPTENHPMTLTKQGLPKKWIPQIWCVTCQKKKQSKNKCKPN